MIVEWKNPTEETPKIKDGEGSVCVMVTPGDRFAQYPVKAWWNGDGHYWIASSGEIAKVEGWDYYPEHLAT
jgi:hypothetical protein